MIFVILLFFKERKPTKILTRFSCSLILSKPINPATNLGMVLVTIPIFYHNKYVILLDDGPVPLIQLIQKESYRPFSNSFSLNMPHIPIENAPY